MIKQSQFLIAILLMALIGVGCGAPTPIPAVATFISVPATSTATLAPTAPPAPTQPVSQDDSWQEVQQAGTLRVGTAADYPPFEYANENSELDGFDIALIKMIGQKLGIQVELNNFDFEALPMAVAAGQIDLAIGAISVTPERQAIANFSNVYYASSDAVLSRPDADPKWVRDTKALASARLGVQVNSIYATYAQQRLLDAGLMPKQNLFIYPYIPQAVKDLLNKRIDAVWMDLKPAQAFAKTTGLKVLAQDLNQQLYAIAMKKDSNALRDKVNEALTQLQNEGTLATLQEKYLGIKPEDVVYPQPLPTAAAQPTPKPPECLDGAEWVQDLSYGDHNHKNPPALNPSQRFTKGWRMRNTGTCTWNSGYSLAYSSGNVRAAQMGGQPIAVTQEVKPGDTFDFQVNLIAPVVAGGYQGYWDMRNTQNQKFGETIWVDIVVQVAATVTPKPPQPPNPNITFNANPLTITEGSPVNFNWNTDHAQFVYFYHDGQKWSEHLVAEDGQATEYPQYSMNYFLHVHQKDGAVYERSIWITVNPAPVNAPVIEYISASPQQIVLDLCTTIDWSVKGNVDAVNLLVDNNVVWSEAPMVGNYQDCPVTAGTHVYMLQASGPGGKNTGQTSVDVMGHPVLPPTPTPTPPEPVVEPPVIQGFNVSPTTIEKDQCVTVSWTTGGGTTVVELSRSADMIWTGPDLNGSVQDCDLSGGPAVVQYTLVAKNNADTFVAQEATVQITQAAPQNPLANTNWKLAAMPGVEVPADVSITAFFSPEGSLNGSIGCGTYASSYSANGQSITLQDPGPAGTQCGDPANGLVKTYLELLPQAANFEISGGQLTIFGNSGQEILLFSSIG